MWFIRHREHNRAARVFKAWRQVLIDHHIILLTELHVGSVMGNENLNGQLSTRQLIKSLQAERRSEMLKQQQEVAARRLIISQRILGKWLQRDKSRAFQKWIQGTRYHVHLDLLNSHVLRMLKAILVRLCLKFKAQAFTTWFQATVKVSRRVTIKSHNQRTAVRVTIVRLFMKFLALAFSRWRSRAYTKHLRDGRAARGRRQLRKRILRRSYTLRSQAWQTWCNWMSTASHVCYRDTWKRRLPNNDQVCIRMYIGIGFVVFTTNCICGFYHH